MKKLIFIATSLAVMALAAQCFGQTPDAAAVAEAKKAQDELCKKILCRGPDTVQVRLKDGRTMNVPFKDPGPIVLPNGWVTIFPGEEIHIAFDLERNVLSNPRAVRKPVESQPTVTFRLTQDPKTADSSLIVQNNVDRNIKFDVGMMLPDSENIMHTSTCPVLAGKRGYEQWPQPIFQLFIAKIRILSAASSMACE